MDEELLRPLPTGTPTNDWYAGHRLTSMTLIRRSHLRGGEDGLSESGIFRPCVTACGITICPRRPQLAIKAYIGRTIKAMASGFTESDFTFIFNRVISSRSQPIEDRPRPPIQRCRANARRRLNLPDEARASSSDKARTEDNPCRFHARTCVRRRRRF